MKIFNFLLGSIVLASWVVGFFLDPEMKLVAWSLPAGYAAGTIIARFITGDMYA